MDRGENVGCEPRVDELPALAADAEVAAQERLRRRRAQTDEHARLHDVQLGLEPRPAGGHLGPVRLLVDAPLAARLPLEVLDDVGDVRKSPVDLRLVEGPVEQLAGGTHERAALAILIVAGLLADEHDLGLLGAFAEDGLRPGLPEIARLAALRRFAKRRQTQSLRQIGGRGSLGLPGLGDVARLVEERPLAHWLVLTLSAGCYTPSAPRPRKGPTGIGPGGGGLPASA